MQSWPLKYNKQVLFSPFHSSRSFTTEQHIYMSTKPKKGISTPCSWVVRKLLLSCIMQLCKSWSSVPQFAERIMKLLCGETCSGVHPVSFSYTELKLLTYIFCSQQRVSCIYLSQNSDMFLLCRVHNNNQYQQACFFLHCLAHYSLPMPTEPSFSSNDSFKSA